MCSFFLRAPFALSGLDKRAEHLRPALLEVVALLEPALQQSLDTLLRFRPCERGTKGVEGVEEPVGGWQRDLVHETLRCRESAPVERGDPARERVDEFVQLRVRKRPV